MTDKLNHLSRRLGFLTLDRGWCDYKLKPSDKHYMTLRHLKQAGNACPECIRRHNAATTKHRRDFDGKPIRGQHDRK